MSTSGTRLVDKSKIVFGTAANNYTGAASTSNWVNLKNYYHASIVIQTGAWAGGTAAVTINQATDTSGTNSKAFAFDTMFTNSGTPASDAMVKTAVVSNTFNLSVANSLYVIEVDGVYEDINNLFTTLQVAIASPGSNADYYSVTFVLGNPARFGGNYALLPTALS
jgi:hypothetical protein